MPPLLQVSGLQTHYVSFGGQRVVKAVDDISFVLEPGEARTATFTLELKDGR